MMKHRSHRYLAPRQGMMSLAHPRVLPSAPECSGPRAAAPRRAASQPKIKRPWIEFDPDGLFAFVLFLVMLLGSMLFAESSATIGAALFVLLVVGYAVVRLNQIGEILAPRAFLLAIPAFTILSTLWSQSRFDTAKYSLEFALTVAVALILSAAPRPKAVLWGMFPAFAIYVVLSVGFGHTVDVGTSGTMAFAGLTDGKNLMADIAANGLLISLACFVAAMEDRRLVRAMLALLVAAVHGYVMIGARSAGSLMGVAAAIGSLIFLLALRPARLSVRIMTTISAVATSVFVVFTFGSALIEDAMTMFDKDPTLTGRTYLWERAGDLIAENPLLGSGYSAFWVQGNPDAEGLWAYAGIQSRAGFNFHNTAIEILVNVGWLGLIVFGITALIAAWLLLRRVMTRPSLTLCFWASVFVYNVARLTIESLGTAPFAYDTVLLFTALGSAFAARRSVPLAKLWQAPSAPPRPLRPVFLRAALKARQPVRGET